MLGILTKVLLLNWAFSDSFVYWFCSPNIYWAFTVCQRLLDLRGLGGEWARKCLAFRGANVLKERIVVEHMDTQDDNQRMVRTVRRVQGRVVERWLTPTRYWFSKACARRCHWPRLSMTLEGQTWKVVEWKLCWRIAEQSVETGRRRHVPGLEAGQENFWTSVCYLDG